MSTLLEEHLEDFLKRLERIEARLSLAIQPVSKPSYSTAEVAAAISRRPFTVREWCRLGRIKARKKNSGRGPCSEWLISEEELRRYQAEGLLPPDKLLAGKRNGKTDHH